MLNSTGEKIVIEYLYKQTGERMEDFVKAIETLETVPDEADDESIILKEAEDSFQDADQIDDLTISTVGLKESSDAVLDISSLPLPQVPVHPLPSSSTKPAVEATPLPIPTPEEYEAEWRNETGDSQTTEVILRYA
ncbi:hypothetical protein DPMN_116083 [Dreissena polymorpha]|uniref:Uncharacterized protein n=1 Tax=Dreissena polymorpha TaxID=45954 RepID=A0A9D4KMF2_DREPO|nr:hypothetical protein DPMN_116083 [Dreissena polymorpha]